MNKLFKKRTIKSNLLIIITILIIIILIFESKNIFFRKNDLINENIISEIPDWVEFADKELSISTSSELNENLLTFDSLDNFYNSKFPYSIKLIDKKVSVKFNDNSSFETDDNEIIQNVLWQNIDENYGDELVVLYWENVNNSFYQYISAYSFLSNEINLINREKFNNDIKNIKLNENGQIVVNRLSGKREILSINNKKFLLKTPMFDYDENIDIVDSKVLINAFGDNLIHSNIYKYGLRNNKNFDFLYEHIKKENDNSDISIINHETMLVNNYKLYSDYPKFGIPIAVGDAIINAGFDIVTCATNHAIDKGETGVIDTLDFYKKNNIICLGIHKLSEKRVPYEIIEKNNIKFSLFNYTYGTNFGEQYEMKYRCINTLQNKQQVIRDIDEGTKDTDVNIVFVHWGTEYKNEITEFQREWAKIFLESGIDIVIGTHPHVLQNVEVMSNQSGKEMLVYYSLGNFISSQNTINTMLGGEAKIEVLKTNNGIKILYDMIPVITHKEQGFITTYLLSDYSDELLKKHKIDFNFEELKNYAKSFINK